MSRGGSGDDERPDLAPYAAMSHLSRGRRYQEEFKDGRPNFERDRDRIIHCTAFRRLEYKTQVFVNHEGDYYRTRLTHTLEVAQISKGIARRLRLNEDLAESIALAHDLGHTPFGHTGEETLQGLMSDCGGFEHNRQSLRVVEELEERYPNFPGLNLTWETREGLVKRSFGRADGSIVPPVFAPHLAPTLEAQIIELADEIAYNNHDIDDGLESGYLTEGQLLGVTIWREINEQVRRKYPGIYGKKEKYQTISHLIGHLIGDLVENTRATLEEKGIRSCEDVRRAGETLVRFSQATQGKNEELKAFLHEKLYRHYKMERMRLKARRTISRLFETYLEHPTLLPFRHQERAHTEPLKRVICDYVAGMTDRYALEEYRRLFDPEERV
ncbi:MAG: deoxyguanosinetriphosphate triphosphohydrolase [Thermodesulfobacteriota bacterium]